MDKLRKNGLFVFTFLLFFGFGIFFGRFYLPHIQLFSEPQDIMANQQLRILILEGVIPEDILENFLLERKIPLEITTAKDEKELLEVLRNSTERFDVVSLFSHQVMQAIEYNAIASLDFTKVHKENISIDFLYPPYDPNGDYTVPIYWGVDGFVYNKQKIPGEVKSLSDIFIKNHKNKISLLETSKNFLRDQFINPHLMRRSLAASPGDSIVTTFNSVYTFVKSSIADITRELDDGDIWVAQMDNGDASKYIDTHKNFTYVIPNEGAKLWTMNFAIVKDSPNVGNAYKFFNFMLKKEIATELVLTKSKASTNQLVEEVQQISNLLKPSYIRKIPIRNLKFADTSSADF